MAEGPRNLMKMILAFVRGKGGVAEIPEIVNAMKRPDRLEREIRATILSLKIMGKLARRHDGSVAIAEKVRAGSITKLGKRMDKLIKEMNLMPPLSAQEQIGINANRPKKNYH